MATRIARDRIRLALSNSLSPKLLIRCKDLGDISYTDIVIAHFVSKFVAVATGVDQG